ncbi:MAG: lysine--tRNA ligase, partial [bacterium]
MENNDVQSVDENTIIQERRSKLNDLRKEGTAFPNHFKPQHLAFNLHEEFDSIDKPELEEKNIHDIEAGR